MIKLRSTLYLTGLVFLASCGGGGGGGSSASPQPSTPTQITTNIPLMIQKSFKLQRGDELQKLNSVTKVEINHDIVTDEITVTLLEGAAQIARKSS